MKVAFFTDITIRLAKGGYILEYGELVEDEKQPPDLRVQQCHVHEIIPTEGKLHKRLKEIIAMFEKYENYETPNNTSVQKILNESFNSVEIPVGSCVDY